ncbi:uncharacterized protein LOC134248917 [Saccostrea cucullata]|uniref:uncharacterized protein LOC134248917 n=1 Tax=Saccostrea cuccullata TaxID=36930 RepID=UPI002ED47808
MKFFSIFGFLPTVGLTVAGTCSEYTITKSADSTLHQAYLYQSLTLSTLIECASYCLRGAKCKALAHTSSQTCKLFTKSKEEDPSLVQTEIGTNYVTKSDLPSGIAGTCSGHVCGEDDLCVQSDSTYRCIPVYGGKRCSKPPGVKNAVVDFADPETYPWGTGDNVRFNCSSNVTPTGGPSVMTCMDTGIWSYSFSC